jgi:hypothetical protein
METMDTQQQLETFKQDDTYNKLLEFAEVRILLSSEALGGEDHREHY